MWCVAASKGIDRLLHRTTIAGDGTGKRGTAGVSNGYLTGSRSGRDAQRSGKVWMKDVGKREMELGGDATSCVSYVRLPEIGGRLYDSASSRDRHSRQSTSRNSSTWGPRIEI